MRDSELFDYLENAIAQLQFPHLILKKKEITGKGFSMLEYKFREGKIYFVIDRSYIEGEIVKNENFTSFSKFDPKLTNLKKSTANIDKIIDFLYNHRDEIFRE